MSVKTVIQGSRCNQYEIIDEAINWLEGKKEDEKYLNKEMSIIIEIIEEDSK